ncbi:MAG TPA: hypothetical protein QGF02_00265 [Candidatus Babeliales bacterium]|nr:hypothetical protein [Candidatus Babeliales bacterium]
MLQKLFARFLLVPLLMLSVVTTQPDFDTVREDVQPAFAVRYISDELLDNATLLLSKDCASNKKKRRFAKLAMYGIGGATALYMGAKFFTVDGIDFPAWLELPEGIKLPSIIKVPFGTDIPEGMTVGLLKAAEENAVPLDKAAQGVMNRVKGFGGSVWSWTHWSAVGLVGFASSAVMQELFRNSANFGIDRFTDIFDTRNLEWCVKDSKVFRYGHKLKLHAAALDINANATKSADHIDISVYPNVDTAYHINYDEVVGEDLKNLITLKRYVGIRQPLIIADKQEQEKEFTLLVCQWNKFVCAMAYSCAYLQWDIAAAKKTDALAARQLTIFKDMIIKEVNKAAKQLDVMYKADSYDNLYSSIQNCMVQCEHIVNIAIDETEKITA